MNLNSRKQWLKTSKNAYSKLVLEFLNAAAPICRLLQMCKYDVNLAQCTLYSTLSLELKQRCLQHHLVAIYYFK